MTFSDNLLNSVFNRIRWYKMTISEIKNYMKLSSWLTKDQAWPNLVIQTIRKEDW